MSEISQSQHCGKCGASLSSYAPDGLCAACLLECALDTPVASPAVPAVPAVFPPSASKALRSDEDAPGTIIGRYKLLEKVGEGGFGAVYVAEQREPVKRRVALKIIKLGMDTRQVVARFEAERQALALMDHPNIAKVLDAGATEIGRPYFVMELVRGIKITDYSDQNNLSTNERLDLFIKICHAIQHAHQKGIIHRDIKPANVLVTVNDGLPVPKVIDFGIAKATQGELSEKTIYTQFQQFIGTPAYMSPEQAEMTSLDIDTRSDIYALGVLLYELLTGKTPFDQQTLLKAGLDGMRRMIREWEPPRPSTRVSALQDAERTTTAKRRGIDPPKLVHQLRGDLDWIVMKCLEKDRTRRYETANGVAMDVQRYLNDEPVVACPPSQLYKFQKFVRRNKLGVAATSAVAASLLVGLGLSTWLWLKEREAHHRLADAHAFFYEGQISRTTLPVEYHERAASSTNRISGVIPPGDPRLNGKTYAQWTADWLKWELQMPLTNSTGAIHPLKISDKFDVAEGQTAGVWFLGAPFLTKGLNTISRSCVIPPGKALFFPLFVVEVSNIEGHPFYGTTAQDQAGRVDFFVAHFVKLFCEVDGVSLSDVSQFRVRSPQTEFTAPAPWIQGEAGGPGTVTGAGYFVFLSPLTPGKHTLHFGGEVSMTWPQDQVDMHEKIDISYQITVAEGPPLTNNPTALLP
jgi:serine/threonine protein kinase